MCSIIWLRALQGLGTMYLLSEGLLIPPTKIFITMYVI